jgi:SAM-dependent methyltransferase
MIPPRAEHEAYYLEREAEDDWGRRAGWRDAEAQRIRFAQLIDLLPDIPGEFEVTDVGCGYGDFLVYLREHGFRDVTYRGVDANPRMIESCVKRFGSTPETSFEVITDLSQLPETDFSIASGVFSGKFTSDDDVWTRYVFDSVEAMYRKSRKGIAFNLLSNSADMDRREDYLYYASATDFFGWATEHLSRSVALLHDYGEHDFTLIVRRKALVRRED